MLSVRTSLKMSDRFVTLWVKDGVQIFFLQVIHREIQSVFGILILYHTNPTFNDIVKEAL